jgi:hypothetical protein
MMVFWVRVVRRQSDVSGNISPTSSESKPRKELMLLLGFDLEGEGDMFIRNVRLSPHYTTQRTGL